MEKKEAYVKLHPLSNAIQILTAFTIDVSYVLKGGSETATILSYFQENKNKLMFFSGYGYSNFTAAYSGNNLDHNVAKRLTITLDASGFSIFIDGKRVTSGQVENKKISLPMNGVWVLGQQQDELEGGFEVGDRFIGDIYHFQMWDFKLNDEQIEDLFSNKQNEMKGNVFDSPATYKYEVKNGAKSWTK